MQDVLALVVGSPQVKRFHLFPNATVRVLDHGRVGNPACQFAVVRQKVAHFCGNAARWKIAGSRRGFGNGLQYGVAKRHACNDEFVQLGCVHFTHVHDRILPEQRSRGMLRVHEDDVRFSIGGEALDKRQQARGGVPHAVYAHGRRLEEHGEFGGEDALHASLPRFGKRRVIPAACCEQDSLCCGEQERKPPFVGAVATRFFERAHECFEQRTSGALGLDLGQAVKQAQVRIVRRALHER